MLAILLGAAGFETAECDGGDGAIGHVQRLTPDVVLLSTTTRGDTIGIARSLRDGDGTSRIPIVLLTGHGDPAFRERALESGCQACLLKPVDVDQLIKELSRVTADSSPREVFPGMPRQTSADAHRFVRECSSSIDSAKVALERARIVSARAQKQVERANMFLTRIGLSRSDLAKS